MAKVREVDGFLLLELSSLEKLGSLHGSIRVPKRFLTSIKEIPNPWKGPDGMRGVRAPGTGIPGVIMLGTLRKKSGKEFAVVYKRGAAKIYEFSDGPFSRWIVSTLKNDSETSSVTGR